jgi:hydantoinase/carbamoylase family amidase
MTVMEISRAQASKDINGYILDHPDHLRYDKSARTYVIGRAFQAHYLSIDPAEYLADRDYIRRKMEDAGLITRVDTVGNLFGRLEGTERGAATLLAGSHLDAVKAGGILDGPLGIVSALEALRAIGEQGIRPRHSLEAVAFIAEEGGPLGGTFGSRSFTGQMETPPAPEVLAGFGLSTEDVRAARGDLSTYGAYLEYHIEQGPVLWRKGLPVGIPTAIVGITRYRVTITGAANHAGTTPMLERKDALYEASVVIHKWVDFVRSKENLVCNVGFLNVEPGQIGIVPGKVSFGVEIRSTEDSRMALAAETLKKYLSEMEGCRGQAELWVEKPPVRLDEGVVRTIESVSGELGYSSLLMPSGASHDASPLARVMPTGMLFVPSVGGVSHCMEEFSEDDDMVKGATVLANLLLRLDRELP